MMTRAALFIAGRHSYIALCNDPAAPQAIDMKPCDVAGISFLQNRAGHGLGSVNNPGIDWLVQSSRKGLHPAPGLRRRTCLVEERRHAQFCPKP
jgi:hypothetical protein